VDDTWGKLAAWHVRLLSEVSALTSFLCLRAATTTFSVRLNKQSPRFFIGKHGWSSICSWRVQHRFGHHWLMYVSNHLEVEQAHANECIDMLFNGEGEYFNVCIPLHGVTTVLMFHFLGRSFSRKRIALCVGSSGYRTMHRLIRSGSSMVSPIMAILEID